MKDIIAKAALNEFGTLTYAREASPCFPHFCYSCRHPVRLIEATEEHLDYFIHDRDALPDNIDDICTVAMQIMYTRR